MAHILAFQTRSTCGTQAQKREHGRSAEIVIFPGVRYERAGGPTPSSAGKVQRRRRDTLELED